MKKKRRGTKPTPTVRQQRAIDGFLAVLRGESNKTIAQVFREANYAPSTVKSWTNVMESLRPHLQPHLDWLEMHRAQIMARMGETIATATYAELTRALEVTTKNHQLLGGKPTHRFGLSQDDRATLEAMIDEDL